MPTLFNLSQDQSREIAQRFFAKQRDSARSFEELSQEFAEYIYKELTQPDGTSAMALVRVFRISKLAELRQELRDLAVSQFPDEPDDAWVTLMGTYGEEPAWRNRRESTGHQVFPARSDFTPMLGAAFRQLGLRTPDAEGDLQLKGDTVGQHYFHVPNAVGSPHIPAQDDFVVPYGIQSVVGIGETLITGAEYMALAFSKVKIDNNLAAVFNEISPFCATILAQAEVRGRIWA